MLKNTCTARKQFYLRNEPYMLSKTGTWCGENDTFLLSYVVFKWIQILESLQLEHSACQASLCAVQMCLRDQSSHG